jgi:hypothetical protein
LADTLDFNNQNKSVPGRTNRFERWVVTDIGLTAEQYEHFSAYLRQRCQQLLETLDDWLAMQEGRIGPARKPERLPKRKLIAGVGVYQFLDELPPNDESPGQPAAPKQIDDEEDE